MTTEEEQHMRRHIQENGVMMRVFNSGMGARRDAEPVIKQEAENDRTR
jgi:hypothetical protein